MENKTLGFDFELPHPTSIEEGLEEPWGKGDLQWWREGFLNSAKKSIFIFGSISYIEKYLLSEAAFKDVQVNLGFSLSDGSDQGISAVEELLEYPNFKAFFTARPPNFSCIVIDDCWGLIECKGLFKIIRNAEIAKVIVRVMDSQIEGDFTRRYVLRPVFAMHESFNMDTLDRVISGIVSNERGRGSSTT